MKRVICLVLILGVMLSFSACSSLFAETYISRHPHVEDAAGDFSNQRYASSYPEICAALTAFVNNGITNGVIILSDINEQVGSSYMVAAIRNVMSQEPMAIYCVYDIQFDLGTNAGRLAAAVNVNYTKSAAEVASIHSVRFLPDAQEYIGQAVAEAAGSIAIRVEQYEETDLTALLSQYADVNPATVMETPQFTVDMYPDTGSSRVIQLNFTYLHSKKDLQKMRSDVEPVFTAAQLYVKGDNTPEKKYRQLHSFLMERFDYTIKSTNTPTYSLLQEGIGDSRAFACVYADMCRRAGLECKVLSGTRSDTVHYFNQVVIDQTVYYIDLLEARSTGKLLLHTASEMAEYNWNRNS